MQYDTIAPKNWLIPSFYNIGFDKKFTPRAEYCPKLEATIECMDWIDTLSCEYELENVISDDEIVVRSRGKLFNVEKVGENSFNAFCTSSDSIADKMTLEELIEFLE